MEEDRNFERVAAFIAVLALVVWLLLGCAPCKQLATSTLDSVRVEVIERTELIHDTVYFEIPQVGETTTAQRDSSYLENEYAMSYACINGDGTLTHSLSTRPQLRKITFTKPIIRRDSVIHHNSFRTIEVEVERERSWWEQTQINGFWAMLIFIAFIFILRRIKRLFL